MQEYVYITPCHIITIGIEPHCCVIDGKIDRVLVFGCCFAVARKYAYNTRFIKRNIILHNSFKLCDAIRSNENCARISLCVMMNRVAINAAVRIFHIRRVAIERRYFTRIREIILESTYVKRSRNVNGNFLENVIRMLIRFDQPRK